MIYNRTRKKEVMRKVVHCKSAVSKSIGLMFSLPKRRALVMHFGSEQRIGLHMLFVFYPIDVLWLDSEKRVVEMKERFLPFTFYNPSNAARYVVELPSGTIGHTGTRVGDHIEF